MSSSTPRQSGPLLEPLYSAGVRQRSRIRGKPLSRGVSTGLRCRSLSHGSLIEVLGQSKSTIRFVAEELALSSRNKLGAGIDCLRVEPRLGAHPQVGEHPGIYSGEVDSEEMLLVHTIGSVELRGVVEAERLADLRTLNEEAEIVASSVSMIGFRSRSLLEESAESLHREGMTPPPM